ncbi:MAG: elongation factor P [Candidatus Nealsonbacteria bacterium CG09_land_8_20_14_0_10_42_14]|uniref:Elongation factor P n=1 Tax=Candidatus Nealsonbacteria bacterium CG09_land_8_20_14_0_10_42_14 TaxID=1974707 RepID=A0A2H0WX35_9BACT|nr:MAG: elongation factor P [Candidatus Nealsonbacteria bacterium CG09_land_8_20_14_0_10_42_14]
MLSHTDLKKGVEFILDKEPYEVLEFSFLVKGRGSSTVQAKIKNLITGAILSRTFHPGEGFEETEIEKIKAKFLYSHRERYFFSEIQNPSKRFDLSPKQIGAQAKFLKPNQIIEAIVFDGKIINVILPIKIQLRVTEAPPGLKGDRAQAGTKMAILETGAQIPVPLFVEQDDTIEINTETEEYVRRIE